MQLSAGIVIVRREQHQWLYLVLRAYRYWDFPKGEMEEGEDPLQTAMRETGKRPASRNSYSGGVNNTVKLNRTGTARRKPDITWQRQKVSRCGFQSIPNLAAPNIMNIGGCPLPR